MGLPGTGKTTFAKKLLDRLSDRKKSSAWYNADHVRHMYDDWDFSNDGRLRQAQRMGDKADRCKQLGIISVCDFVCPTEYLREVFDADLIVWMDTIKESRYKDTDDLFENPSKYTYRVQSFDQFEEILNTVEDLLCTR